jgi:hypothetical protein
MISGRLVRETIVRATMSGRLYLEKSGMANPLLSRWDTSRTVIHFV